MTPLVARLDQAGAEGQAGEVGAAAAAGLVPDPVQVRADRADADVQLGEATVKTHVGRLLGKLHLRDRVQAVIYAYENGIILPGSRSGQPGGG